MRVALTQRRAGAERVAARLREEGFDAAVCPLIRVEAVGEDPIALDGYDWLVLTSRTGVELLFERAAGAVPPVAVIGPGTAEALRERGVEPTVVARRSTQEGLVAELPRPAGRVLFAGAEGARDTIVRELDADFVPLYRTIEESPKDFPAVDLVVLASASAARSFARVGSAIPCVSIGPVTSREARKLGLDVVVEAERHDADGLVEAVKLARSSVRSSPS